MESTSNKQTEQTNNDEQSKKKILRKKDIIIKQQRRDKSIQRFAGTIKKHTEDSYTQGFSSYNDIYGSEDLNYDLIDGLYRSTILNRIFRKLANDAVPDMFQVQVVDMDGNRIPDIELECFQYTAALKRKHIKKAFLTQLLYGTAFIYIGNKEEEVLNNIFLLHPRDLEPEIDNNGEVENWIYSGGDEDVDISPEDLIVLPYDPDLGDVYGKSALGPLVHTLNLYLNTELNLSEIVDKFAVPILQWLIEVGEDEELQEDELEGIVNSIQSQLEYANDIVTTDKIKTETIGFAQSQYDMVSTLAALKESLGLLTFPFQLIGAKSDNLSSIKVQSSQYINDLKDLQTDMSDNLVEQLYEPFLESKGHIKGQAYANIYLVFPILTVESNGEAAAWVFPALKHGLITRDEARAQFSFRGKAIPLDEIEFIDQSFREFQEQQNSPDVPKDGTEVKEARDRSGRGDEDTKKEDRKTDE